MPPDKFRVVTVERMKEKLNGNYLKLITGLSIEQNKLIDELKMAEGDMISIGGG